MIITKISITNLFNIFNHEINMQPGGITIIHGPNGFGKTIILKMLDGMFRSDYSVFKEIPFSEFIIEFDNNIVISISRNKNGLYIHDGKERKPIRFDRPLQGDRYVSGYTNLEDIIPDLVQVSPSEYIIRSTQELLTISEIILRYRALLPNDLIKKIEPEEPELLKQVKKSFTTQFIKIHRLQSYNAKYSSRMRSGRDLVLEPTVIKYSKDLVAKIKNTVNMYGIFSQNLDRDFPQKLLQGMSGNMDKKYSVEEISQILENQEIKRQRLMITGLLSTNIANEASVKIPEQLDDDRIRYFLSVYLDDVTAKLSQFDMMLDRIELFTEIVNNRFHYKKLKISPENGFIFFGNQNNELPISELSSGEQHQIVMLYELLFELKKNSLVLIDEPELSLHIEWQRDFLSDLERIIALSEVNVLIATHSPDIINGRVELLVALEGPDK